MANEGLIDRAEAVKRVEPEQLDSCCTRGSTRRPAAGSGDRSAGITGRGQRPGLLRSGPGAERAANGEKVILIREETSPDDFHGMVAARGLVTARGA